MVLEMDPTENIVLKVSCASLPPALRRAFLMSEAASLQGGVRDVIGEETFIEVLFESLHVSCHPFVLQLELSTDFQVSLSADKFSPLFFQFVPG